MEDMPNSLIDGNPCSYRKEQNSNNKTPKIDLLSVPEGKLLIRRLFGLLDSIQQ